MAMPTSDAEADADPDADPDAESVAAADSELTRGPGYPAPVRRDRPRHSLTQINRAKARRPDPDADPDSLSRQPVQFAGALARKACVCDVL